MCVLSEEMAEEKREMNIGELAVLLKARVDTDSLAIKDCLECTFGVIPDCNFVSSCPVVECNFTEMRQMDRDEDVVRHVRQLYKDYRDANPESTLIIRATEK